MTAAREAWARIEPELVELRVEGRPVWLHASDEPDLAEAEAPGRTVRLLPAFDTYLLGYAWRDAAVAPKHQPRIFHGGQIVPVVLVDGVAAGTWRHARRGKAMVVTATPFTRFSAETRDLIAEETDDIGRFFGLSASLSFAKGA